MFKLSIIKEFFRRYAFVIKYNCYKLLQLWDCMKEKTTPVYKRKSSIQDNHHESFNHGSKEE